MTDLPRLTYCDKEPKAAQHAAPKFPLPSSPRSRIEQIVISTGHPSTPTPEHGSDTTPAPARIAEILLLLQALAAYGRHLADSIPRRTLWRGFATVAQFFGTAAIPDITLRIQRGILRALALQSVLLKRAERGRDLVFLSPRLPTTRAASKARVPGETPPLTVDSVPSQAELEAWARRRPIGRTIADICLDLGISPSLCSGPFWNRLFDAIQEYRGSLPKLLQELRRRARKFDKEPRPSLPWPARDRGAIQQALGFFIGEKLPDPATGPP
jgi:hypothetical protein